MPRSRRDKSLTRQRRPLLLYLVFVLTWLFASGMILVAVNVGEEDASDPARTASGFFVAGTGILVVAFIARDQRARRESHGLLAERDALIASIGVITDPRLTQLPLYRMLDELLGRARTVLRADTAAVFLLDEETKVLRRTATSGIPDSGRAVTVPLGEGLIGRVAESKRGQALADAPQDPAIAMSRSVLAVPLIAEGKRLGVLQIGTVVKRQFDDDEVRLLQMVADRASVAIEGTRLERSALRARLSAEGARRRLELLADAGGVLGRSFNDAQRMMDALGEALVPEFLDWFAFREASPRAEPLTVERAGDGVAVSLDGEGWRDVVPALLEDGSQSLIWGEDLVDERWRWAQSMNLSSLIAVPVRGAREVVGLLLLGTTGDRRGFRTGDLATAVDLAARVAVAIERVRLVAQTQQSALRAARHATQLQRLTEAAFAVNTALDAEALARVVAEQTANIFDADGAWVELAEERGARRLAEFGRKPPRAREARADLTDAAGATVGAVGVLRSKPLFSSDEQAVLSSLAQTVSVALANARLYGTVQDSEARMRALYDASPVGIVELAEDGRAVRWNRAAETLFGWPAFRTELAGSVVAPDAARDVVAGALAGADPRPVDVTLGEVEAELVAVPLAGSDGPAGAVLAVVDVTERKHIAEQLQHAQRMEAMARMAGGIAHDFNNVLMVISGYADLALRRRISEPVRADIEGMKAAAGRAAEFTRKLLTVSRRQVVQPQRIDVVDAVTSLEGVLPVMMGDDITLDLRVDSPPPVLIDPSQFEQLILNLAINARDAMPRGGRLEIHARGVKVGRKPMTELVVADTGEGMDAETVEHCFEPFFTTKDRTKGTGLGLSTVYSVVTQAGGTIDVASEPGEGTTFTIHLPLAPAEAEPPVAATATPASAMRILVVDDEPEVRAIVADMLELDGHDVRTAADGNEALAALAESVPDVLLTDVVMPGMRGTELAKLAQARYPNLRVVLMSAHVGDDLALDPDAEGALFLAKPFSTTALSSTLAAATGKRRRRRTRLGG